MSNLPQRKKTPEEIAKLRESMGLGGPAPDVPSSPRPALPDETSAKPEEAPMPATPVVIPPSSPALIHPMATAGPVPEIPATPAPTPVETRAPGEPKPVRSLRKSERLPAPAAAAKVALSRRDGPSHLPTQRRGEIELNDLRRAQAFSVQPPAAHLIALTAHPLLVGAGYFCVIAAAILPFIDHFFTDITRYAPATLCLIGLAIAGFIFLKKKRSLHNAGFIAAIAIFTLIFGALYYFPHLRNAP